MDITLLGLMVHHNYYELKYYTVSLNTLKLYNIAQLNYRLEKTYWGNRHCIITVPNAL